MLAAFARLCAYLGISLVLGDVALSLGGVTTERSLRRKGERIARVGWVLLLFGVLMLLVEQATAMELSISDLGAVLTQTTWGRGWSLLAACVLAGVCTSVLAGSERVTQRRATRARWWLSTTRFTAILAIVSGVAMGGIGHSAADEAWPITARILDAAHVLSIGAWIGGLLLLTHMSGSLPALLARTPSHSAAHGANSAPTVPSANAWRAFSRIATVGAPMALLSGVGVSLRRLSGAPIGEITNSRYGQLLIAKVALVLIVLALGARHRRQLTVSDAPPAKSLQRELWFALAVLMLTSVLTGTAPPGE